MKKLALHWKILIALILAFSIGLWANFTTESTNDKPVWFENLHYFSNFIGRLFIDGRDPLGHDLHYLRGGKDW